MTWVCNRNCVCKYACEAEYTSSQTKGRTRRVYQKLITKFPWTKFVNLKLPINTQKSQRLVDAGSNKVGSEKLRRIFETYIVHTPMGTPHGHKPETGCPIFFYIIWKRRKVSWILCRGHGSMCAEKHYDFKIGFVHFNNTTYMHILRKFNFVVLSI